MIITNVFSDFTGFTDFSGWPWHTATNNVARNTMATTRPKVLRAHGHTTTRYVKSVFIVHVGGTRCVTFSIENIMNIRARITWTVEFIRGYIFICLLYV